MRTLWILLVLSTAGCGTMVRVSEQRVLTAVHEPGRAVRIETSNGVVNLAVDPTLTQVEIDAEVTTSGLTGDEARARLAATEVVTEREPDGTLHLFPVFPDGRKPNDGCDFRVWVPSVNGVTIATSNGAIAVQGSAGSARLDSTNGSIRLTDHHGDAILGTTNGSIRVERVDGAAQLTSANGRIQIEGVPGAVVARTTNASIRYAAPPNQVGGGFELVTSNGAVDVCLDPSAQASLRASTTNGRVWIDNPAGVPVMVQGDDRSSEIELGGGGPRSTVRTTNGNVTICIGG